VASHAAGDDPSRGLLSARNNPDRVFRGRYDGAGMRAEFSRRLRVRVFQKIATLAATAGLLAGCTGVPSFGPNPLRKEGPPLEDVVKHITCTIGKIDIEKLKNYNFVASINMTMKVSNAEGANATLNFIEPWRNSTNFTAILGGNYTATQTRQVNLQYITDLTRLSKGDACKGVGEGDEIRGDLGLHDTVLESLKALNAGAQFNVYGPKGHPDPNDVRKLSEARSAITVATPNLVAKNKTAASAEASKKVDDALANGAKALVGIGNQDDNTFEQSDTDALKQYRTALESLRDKLLPDQTGMLGKVMDAIDKVNEAISKDTSGKAPEQTSVGTFSATIEFQVQEGGGVGPSWTLSTFKGPSGGSTQPLNFSRNTDDTLVITFAPTCYIGPDRTAQALDYWKTIPECPRGTAAIAKIQNNAISQAKGAEGTVILQQVIPGLVGR
jgi:hypothetical protein